MVHVQYFNIFINKNKMKKTLNEESGLEGGLSAFKSKEVIDLAQKIAAA